MMLWGVALLALAQAAPLSAPVAAPDAVRPDYIDGFCAPIAGGYAEGPRFYALLAQWKGRPGSTADGDALKPRDAEVAGQLIRFPETPPAGDAPAAFVDARSGQCALVWPQAEAPAAVRDALRQGALPVGPSGAAQGWVKVSPVYAGRPRPPKWLMPIGERTDAGVCAELRTDLARRDGAPATLLALRPCRLAPDETLKPGL